MGGALSSEKTEVNRAAAAGDICWFKSNKVKPSHINKALCKAIIHKNTCLAEYLIIECKANIAYDKYRPVFLATAHNNVRLLMICMPFLNDYIIRSVAVKLVEYGYRVTVLSMLLRHFIKPAAMAEIAMNHNAPMSLLRDILAFAGHTAGQTVKMDQDHMTIFYAAIINNRIDVLKHIKSSITSTQAGLGLIKAAETDNEKMTEYLLSAFIIETELDYALIFAAQYDSECAIATLLRHGADPCARDGLALRLAARLGHRKTITALMQSERLRDATHIRERAATQAQAHAGCADLISI